jgi:hypothetical protein
MTPLAWTLWIALAWCLFLFGYAIVYRPSDSAVSRTFLQVHVGVFAAIIALQLFWFLGLGEYGSPRIPTEKQRRIEHPGFYTGPSGLFTFAGEPRANQFPAPPLAERERISLRPHAPAPGSTPGNGSLPLWTVSYRCWRFPLRVDDVARNVNDDWWLAPAATIEVRAGDDFFTMQYRVEDPLIGRTKQELAFRFGIWNRSARRFYEDEEVVLRTYPIRDGIAIGALLRNAPADQLGPGGQVAPSLLALADALTIVRERRDDLDSRLGLLVDDHDVEKARVTKGEAELTARVTELRVESTVPAGAVLSYGLGDSNRFAIRIPSAITNSGELGPVVIAEFLAPRQWPLPPALEKQFLISSRQEDSPVDGYWLDVGSGERAFYAKATLRSDLSALQVNSGSVIKDYALNQQFLLGDRVHGAVASLANARQSIAYAGPLAIGILAIVALAFALALPRDDDSPGTRMNIAYVLVWELTVLILSTRLVLAYRGSLLPPADARVKGLFDAALDVSMAAFALIPLALVLPSAVRRLAGTSATKTTGYPGWWIWIPPTLLSIYVCIAALAGQPSLFMRVNHATVIGMLIFLAWTGRHWTTFRSVVARTAFLAFLTLPLVLNMFLLDDRGAYVYLIAFLLVMWLQTAARRAHASGIIRTAGAMAVVLALTLLPLIATWVGRAALRQRQIGPGTETLYYRLIAQSSTETDVMGQEVGEVPVSRQLLLRNVHQNWQMRLYATTGAREPSGYGLAPLTNRGMSYPVMLTDALFSQLLLVEHGLAAAFGVVAAYVFFAIVCLHAALFLPDSARHRLFPLAAAAALVGLAALYMASGNIGIAVFTGLNMPLLGLYSWSDVILGGAIALLVAWLLTWGIRTSYTTPVTDRPLLKTMVRTAIAGMAVWLVALFFGLLDLRGVEAQRNLQDYRLERDLVQKLRDHLNPPADRNPCWKLNTATSQYDVAPGCIPSVLEQLAINELNQRADKHDPRGGFLYLDGSTVAINDNYFTVTSPFRKQDLWNGRILTSETSADVGFVLLGKPVRLSLGTSGAASSVFLNRPVAQRLGSSVLIAERASQLRLCEISRMSNGQTWISSKHVPGWRIFVDGVNIDDDGVPAERACGQPHSSGCRRLIDGDVVVLERRAEGKLDQRYALLYVGNAPMPVLLTKWINGSRRHILPQPSLASIGYTLGYAIDRMPSATRPIDVTIGIDPAFHAGLQEIVERYARSDANYRKGDALRGRRIAVTAIDSATGETLALAVWPPVDARATDFERRLETMPSRDQYRMLQNANYANHAIGSTIKPLVFSTIATALAPRYRIEQMVVFNRADKLDPPPAETVVHPHTQIAGLMMRDAWDCQSAEETIDARTFLVRSRNYYEAILGLIGLFQRPEEWELAMRPAEGPADLEYAGVPLTFDAKRIPNYPMTAESPAFARTETMKVSLLFRTMPQLFPVNVASGAGEGYPRRCNTFLPNLCVDATKMPVSALRFSVPEPVLLQPQDFQEFGLTYVRGFLIGGALSRWNNVALAESIARVATGRRIDSRLEAHPIGPPALRPVLPGPVGVTAWRNQHLVTPLTDVVEDDVARGTASRLGDVVPNQHTVIAKTGTIDEGTSKRESELLTAVVGLRVDGEFVHGRTVALAMYMEQSKGRSEPMKKFDLAAPVLRHVAAYLDGRVGGGVPPPSVPPPDDPQEPLPPEPLPPPAAAPPAPPPGDGSGVEGVLERTLEGVVAIYTDEGSGTGFFAPGCRIVTNHHVIAGASRIDVMMHDGTRYTADVLGSSPTKDLAILSISARRCVALPFETDRPHLGGTVFTIGHPFELNDSVSRGIVSAPIRYDGQRNVIQVDAAVNPGNSGGPLINEQGRVLGITTYKRRGGERLNFAIAISELQQQFGSLLR